MRNVLAQTDGEMHLWPATLYGALESMAQEALIRELGEDELPEGVRGRKRYYRITEDGRAALRVEALRLSAMSTTALERLGSRSR